MPSPISNASGFKPRKDAVPPNVRVAIGLVLGGIAANVAMVVFGWSFVRSFLLGCTIAYLPTYFDSSQHAVTPREGSRYWPWFAEMSLWRWLFSYFPTSITTDYDFPKAAKAGGQFVFAVHPHGALSIDHFIFFTDAVGFLTKVLPAPRRDLGASVIFLIPFFRDFCLWLGLVDAGASTVHRVLSNGYSLQLFPGGIAEQVGTDSTKPKVVAKGRMGFIKLALSYDVPIVPVYVFGEDKLYTSLTWFKKFRETIAKVLRIGIPLFYGRLDSFGLLPEREPLEAILGEPLWPKGVNEATQKDVWQKRLQANNTDAFRKEKIVQAAQQVKGAAPTAAPVAGSFLYGRRVRRDVAPEEVQEMHDRYIAALTEIFEKHKHKHPKYAKATLEIVASRG